MISSVDRIVLGCLLGADASSLAMVMCVLIGLSLDARWN